MDEHVYTIFIDTRNKNQDPSNFNVSLPDYFVRTSIKNDDKDHDWYISVKNFSMLNSFNNITRDINDQIILYEEITAGSIQSDPTYETIDTSLFTKQTLRIPEGNPSAQDVETEFNTLFETAHGIKISFKLYNSKYTLEVSADRVKKQYLLFPTLTAKLFGFQVNTLIPLYTQASHIYQANAPCNMIGDYLLLFSIDQTSDFKLQYQNYTNVYYDSFNDTNIFHIQPINAYPYDLIYYQKSYQDLIPIQPYKK